MLNTSTQNLIAEVVDEKVDNDEMFTAFEVSLEVQNRARSRGETVERHKEMKESIHQEMDRFLQHGVYEKALHDVGAPSQAFVYFPVGENPDNYRPMARAGIAPAPTAGTQNGTSPAAQSTASITNAAVIAATSARNAVPKSPTDCANLARTPDARGTLTVPAILMLAANFRPHDKVVFYGDTENGNEVGVIAHQAPPGGDILTTYTVDKDCNVRITAKSLEEAGIGSDYGLTQSYDFVGGNDHIMIRPHN